MASRSSSSFCFSRFLRYSCRDTSRSVGSIAARSSSVSYLRGGSRFTTGAGPEGVNSEPEGVNAGPQGVNAGPQGVNAGPEGVNAGPEGVNAGPEGVNSEPEGVVFGRRTRPWTSALTTRKGGCRCTVHKG
eukprot:5152732-Pyramimonas_sp.AAC.1